MKPYETHTCTKMPVKEKLSIVMDREEQAHLLITEDTDFMYTQISVSINVCPFCGEKLNEE